MKKMLILAACAVFVLAWTIFVNAKENSSVIHWWATTRSSWKTCDFDNNWKVNIADVTWFIDYCKLTQKWGARCDMNWNKKVDIGDFVNFQDVCINMLLKQSNWGQQSKATRSNPIRVENTSNKKRSRR